MNELSTLTFIVLFGLLALYVAVFWGISLASLIVSYLHDGDKDFSAFYASEKWRLVGIGSHAFTGPVPIGEVQFIAGFIYPLTAFFVLCMLAVLDKETGQSVTLYIITVIASAYLTLRIARAVTRLTKRLKAHEADKKAHK